MILPEKIATSCWAKEMIVALQTAKEAGQILLEIQNSYQDLHVEQKNNGTELQSPVTIADMRANAIVCTNLYTQFPTYGLLSEESAPDAPYQEAIDRWQTSETTWIVDPLDGTKSFILHRPGYGVHIGLTHEGIPVLGVNYYPETDTTYFAIQGCGAYKQVGDTPPQPLHITSFTNEVHPLSTSDFLNAEVVFASLPYPCTPAQTLGSTGLKICAIAEGGPYNLFLTLALRGGIWDYCSGQVILLEAGGLITDWMGNPINYRSTDGKLTDGVLICTDSSLLRRVLDILHDFR